MPRKIVPYFIFFIILSACSHRQHDLRLSEISEIVSDSPKEALRQLDSIDYSNLSSDDRYYHDFLTLKAKDKAYITHKSDSIILRLLNHYEGTDLYPEILYYGGRVYSDLGDYPTALRYFQNALDLLPEDTNNQKLRGHVLSQTGRLLNKQRLYNQAIPYLESVIRVDSILSDSINLMFDTQLLGAIYLHRREYKMAENKFKAARLLAERHSPIDVYTQDMYLAGIKLYNSNIDSALAIIRSIIPKIHPDCRNIAISYASDIYLQSNILDTAYFYASELITDPNSYNKATGYRVILSPQLKNYLPQDSVYPYILQYSHLMQTTLRQNEKQGAILQNSFYNYKLHEREREKAENSKEVLQKWMIAIIAILLFTAIIALSLKNKNTRYLLQLHEAIDDLNELKKSIDKNIVSNNDSERHDQTTPKIEHQEIAQSPKMDGHTELANRLRDNLLNLQKNALLSNGISHIILESEAYAKLQDHINKSKYLTETNSLWEGLEKAVIESSKNFKYHLLLLTGGNLKTQDYHLALLIKCGVTPTQMSFLVGKAKGTISYRREALCFRIFGQNLGVKVIDDIIRSL